MRNLLLVLLLVGCSSGPTYYDRQSWATVGVDQANAECDAHYPSQSQTEPLHVHAGQGLGKAVLEDVVRQI